MQMTKVESSNIAELGHDAVASELLVLFKTGVLYRYQNVSVEIYQRILMAESIGTAFGALVRKFPEQFPYEKVS